MSLRLDAATMAPRDRAEGIRHLIWQQVVEVEITHQSDPVHIQAVGQISDIGSLNICSIRSNATTVERTARLTHEATDAFVFLGLQGQGSSMVVQDGREAILRPGDLALYDTRRPYTLLNDEGINQHFFRVPVDSLAMASRTLESITACRLDGRRPFVEVTSTHLRNVASRAASMSDEQRELLAAPTLALLRAMLAGQVRALSSDDVAACLELRIMQFVQAHLGDRDLSPPRIAAEHHISVRHLYTLLSSRAESPVEWIMSARLAAARDELARCAATGRRDGAVRAAAYRWGFCDQSHFTRRFKAAYGLTPGEFLRRT